MLRAMRPPQELHVCPSPSKDGGEPRSELHRWKNSNKGPPLMEQNDLQLPTPSGEYSSGETNHVAEHTPERPGTPISNESTLRRCQAQ